MKVLDNWLRTLLTLQVWEKEGQGGVKKGQEADEGLSHSSAAQAKINDNWWVLSWLCRLEKRKDRVV